MSGRADDRPPPEQQPSNAFFNNTLTPAQTRYLLDKSDLQQFLREKFPNIKDFKISVSVTPDSVGTGKGMSVTDSSHVA